MIPHIPRQRQNKNAVHRPFSDLVRYLLVTKELQLQEVPHKEVGTDFSQLVDYAAQSVDQLSKKDKCIAVRVHGVTSIETAALEMNAVAEQNTRSPDKTFHFLLSWPEFEKPEPEAIFDAAVHAITSLGLGQHQYVIAVHDNTDNRHCHIAVNRINPVTFKSHHIEWAKMTLNAAARESEIKHGWFHDNGPYVVQVGPDGKKEIVLNSTHKDFEADDRAERGLQRDSILPSWHDPDSLESWLKGYVGAYLKRDLRSLRSWQDLHVWLDRYGVSLKNTGGGGIRIAATSYITGEILELPLSKGLRMLRRPELEKQWGKYHELIIPEFVPPPLPNLSPVALAKGIDHVLSLRDTTHHDIVYRPERARRDAAERSRAVSDVPSRDVAGPGRDAEVLLQDSLRLGMGDIEARQGDDLRRPSAGSEEERRPRVDPRRRDPDAREKRREERAAARADLRKRYGLYRKVLNSGAGEYFDQLRALRKQHGDEIKSLNKDSANAKRDIRKSGLSPSDKLLAITTLDVERTRRRALIDAQYGHRFTEHRASRPPSLGWREWLAEQANLGDQAAVSALRGIVYQARRDAKQAGETIDDYDEERASKDAAYRSAQHQRTIARLVDEERKEVAIRSARADAMRPHEMDALLVRYAGIQWHVTGNGNIEFSDRGNHPLFTDRGNRITFDRVMVLDEEIRMALMHSRQKFGRHITLTGSDPIFMARMARLADDLGMVVLNPELEGIVVKHREDRAAQFSQITSDLPAPAVPVSIPFELVQQENQSPSDQLKNKVLAIDPKATFTIPDANHHEYDGPLIASQEDGGQTVFAQHVGRSRYVIHTAPLPTNPDGTLLTVRYRNGQLSVSVNDTGQDKSR